MLRIVLGMAKWLAMAANGPAINQQVSPGGAQVACPLFPPEKTNLDERPAPSCGAARQRGRDV